jgi:hypothetical protein
MTVLSQKTYSGSLNTSRLRRKTHVHRRRHTWRNRASRDHSVRIGADIKALCAHGNEDKASFEARDHAIRQESSDAQTVVAGLMGVMMAVAAANVAGQVARSTTISVPATEITTLTHG